MDDLSIRRFEVGRTISTMPQVCVVWTDSAAAWSDMFEDMNCGENQHHAVQRAGGAAFREISH
jgi:hypothetical protein